MYIGIFYSNQSNKTNSTGRIKILKTIKGILSDIDGTLYFKGVPTPGAIEAVSKLKKRKQILFLTNTDSKTPNSIHKKLLKLGFSIKKKEIFTPIIAIKTFLRKNPEKRIFLVTTKEIEIELINHVQQNHFINNPDFQFNIHFFMLRRQYA